eukprot:GHVU01161689.1.p1 GENE.GHVU01161689.1~~GHVU01161689.1.p1  ORF type:complete len:110 (+),score=9.55 GHVU01161689.1:563-892(+)
MCVCVCDCVCCVGGWALQEAEVFRSTAEHTTGINFDSYESIPVEIAGEGAENIEKFTSFQDVKSLHPLLVANVARVNYTKPTPGRSARPLSCSFHPSVRPSVMMMGCCR